jgi:hypothetical protein
VEGGVSAVKAGAVGPEVTVMVCEFPVVEPSVLLATTLKVYDPDVVGVPDKTPVELRVRPGGRVPVELKLGAGLPEAVKV